MHAASWFPAAAIILFGGCSLSPVNEPNCERLEKWKNGKNHNQARHPASPGHEKRPNQSVGGRKKSSSRGKTAAETGEEEKRQAQVNQKLLGKLVFQRRHAILAALWYVLSSYVFSSLADWFPAVSR